MDQNEKLVMYGVTHIRAVDGFSQDCGIRLHASEK